MPSNPYESPREPSENQSDITSVADLHQPPLFSDASFWGLTVTQFLGAFNDNVYKQLVLLLFVAVPVAAGETRDIQWLLCFSLPFTLFSGYAGYLSDRYGKQRIIVICKVAEIAIMLTGAVGFFVFTRVGPTP